MVFEEDKIYPSLVLVQPRKTRPCLNERLLIGRKESNQTFERLQINYMSRVTRKRFFGVHAPDSPACVHVDTELNTSLLILD